MARGQSHGAVSPLKPQRFDTTRQCLHFRYRLGERKCECAVCDTPRINRCMQRLVIGSHREGAPRHSSPKGHRLPSSAPA